MKNMKIFLFRPQTEAFQNKSSPAEKVNSALHSGTLVAGRKA
jgi:hypothetical protein